MAEKRNVIQFPIDRPRVRIDVGRCPICGAVEEDADGSIRQGHTTCARGHQEVTYEIVGGYYEDEAESWSE